ncbi:MAG TPA: cyclic nucleotide-binding domain-containing protein [bacterium]|nr:cyclic nucleotide-binding domain-containing protein [bacterium]
MSDPRQSAVQELAALPIFVEVPNRELEEMLTRAQRRTYRADETIFREGDPPAFLYYIISGEIGVSLTSDDRRINVSRLGPG